ncbi:MerC domain-containing protein [Glaciecola siphonariae]|uniref:MerC domain-containing protein n=1 Tax=Glaciecola siphonariae TaxID=521012 RepID=A0ABV9M0T6_9ALTE
MNKVMNIGDKLAIGVSSLCVLHCALVPLVLFTLPLMSTLFIFDEGFHVLLVLAVIPISVLTILFGYLQHRQSGIVLMCAAGLLALVMAIIFGHDLFNGKGEVILTVIGSAFLVFSHIRNFALRSAYIHP